MKHDPGGSKKFPLQPGVTGGATFSECGRYRHELWRKWDGNSHITVLSIGMNPSTAEADVDDPTVRRDIGFAREWGATRLLKCNVMDYRATYPADLRKPGVQPCSEMNGGAIMSAARRSHIILASWGMLPKDLRCHADAVVDGLTLHGFTLHCLGRTKDGSPRHPLYVKGGTKLEVFAVGRKFEDTSKLIRAG